MLLIDALYINNSGGLRLLEYLMESLNVRGEDYYLLADARCRGKFDECRCVRYLKATLLGRNRFYSTEGFRFSMVLCFGNIPAPVKLDVPVYTYFHNINLLTCAETEKLKSWLKREVFRHYKKNTYMWLVQTSNTANELVKHLREEPDRVKLMPFFELPPALKNLTEEPHGNDYVYISAYYPAKGHQKLIDAWSMLHRQGIDVTLHLTVGHDSKFCDVIKKAQAEGVRIVNHGLIGFDQVIALYRRSKAIVYPSHNESLGLGLVEAITAGCDVIGADMPYTYAVCRPSKVFDPYSAESIADAVIAYEKGGAVRSELVIRNMMAELIDLLTKPETMATKLRMGGNRRVVCRVVAIETAGCGERRAA